MKSCTADGGMEVCEHEGVGLEEAMFYSKVVGRTLYLAFASVTWRKFLLVSWLRRDTGLSTCRKRGRTVTAIIAFIAEFAPPKPYMITVLHSGVCAPYCHTIAPCGAVLCSLCVCP